MLVTAKRVRPGSETFDGAKALLFFKLDFSLRKQGTFRAKFSGVIKSSLPAGRQVLPGKSRTEPSASPF